MSLMVLMYHRATAGPLGNSPALLDEHFGHVAQRTANVLPGERLATDRLNVCLSFDDGYFDFWSVVFPLLQKHGLRAVLAVSPGLVRETVEFPTQARMGLSAEKAHAQPSLGGLCVWGELETMARSGHVEIAAHGYTHTRLDADGVDLTTEIKVPQVVLGARLERTVNTFVLPYGRFSLEALRQVKTSYRHVFRIGSALNRNWNSSVIYRVDADRMTDPLAFFSGSKIAGYRARYWWNRLRGR